MVSRRWGLFAAALAVAIAASVSSAGAQDTSVTIEDIGGNETATITAEFGSPGQVTQGASSATAGVWPYDCIFLNDFGAGGVPQSPVIGSYYQLYCIPNEPGIAPIGPQLYLYDPASPIAPGLVSAMQVRTVAQDFFTIPGFETKLSPDATRQITGLETWFWPDGSLADRGAVASLGALTVEIRAEFVETRIDLGEPGQPILTCTEQVEWAADATSDCVHTYLTEATGRQVTMTNVWDFHWSQNGDYEGIYKRELHSQTVAVNVADLEAVIQR